VAYGRELAAAGAAQAVGGFTDDPDADAFIERDPNAFLIGVLFTQGIPAERAWEGPYLLRERLGHLDLQRLAMELDSVREAVQAPPMLHRFKETIPRWISLAAGRLLDEWGGDASRIWAPGSHVLEVTERLSRFEGVGQKKAAMAVEILVRHFGADLMGIECGQVAYDVHVRRVFLRSGLAREDTVEAVRAAAEQLCPESPGLVDLPAWLVGRETCRPRSPLCDRCRLGQVCPRMTWIRVEGVGVRRAGRESA
jgi:uncharacterized HhH-GPD family protein